MAMRSLSVPPEADGWRVDRFLRRYLPELPSQTVRDAFNRRDVKADGIRVRQDHLLSTGQSVQIYYMEPLQANALDIVYEDADVLLVNKRAGISVEKDEGGGVSLTELCSAYIHEKAPDAPSPVPCHRLDNKTCGLCLFALNPAAADILLEVFRTRALEKYYICLVKGFMKPPSAVCKAFLLKDAENAKVTVSDHPVPGSREIITGYETIENGEVSRLRVHLITGRTHQIRAHMATLGHPLLGDDVYGDRSFNRARKCRRLCLCAAELTLDTGGKLPNLDGKHFRIDPPF